MVEAGSKVKFMVRNPDGSKFFMAEATVKEVTGENEIILAEPIPEFVGKGTLIYLEKANRN
jgi:hypothetical protein